MELGELSEPPSSLQSRVHAIYSQEVLFTEYISYFSDDVMKVEYESWSGSAKSVSAATRSNSSAQSDHSSMVQTVDRVWEW